MIIDALGNPIHFMLTGGQVHDSKAAVDMLLDIHIFGSSFLGDKAYDSQGIRNISRRKPLYLPFHRRVIVRTLILQFPHL